ncbi:MAG TPA: glycosyltransferase, partial [Candidatus Saccharimonadia bacterium]
SDEDRTLLHRVGTLYVMPSPVELQSLSTLEAMASGQPIIAVRNGVLLELCHEHENGLLFELDDPDDLAAQIHTIVADPKLREHMSQESIRIAGTHELHNVIQQFIGIYQDVIARHDARAAAEPSKA